MFARSVRRRVTMFNCGQRNGEVRPAVSRGDLWPFHCRSSGDYDSLDPVWTGDCAEERQINNVTLDQLLGASQDVVVDTWARIAANRRATLQIQSAALQRDGLPRLTLVLVK